VIGDLDVTSARQRFAPEEDVLDATSFVLIVLSCRHARTRWERLAHIGQQLFGQFIETDHGPSRVLGFGIEIEQIFHLGHEVGIFLGRNAPLLLQMRLEDVFF